MGLEIERKFLVGVDFRPPESAGTVYRQGYLPGDRLITTRVRIAGERGLITIKGPSQGATRAEFEYDIPLRDAEQMLAQLCERPLVEKVRYELTHAGKGWSVDIFSGENQGLRVAEIELESEDEVFECPPWVGREVTGLKRYYNVQLVEYPFCRWRADECG